MIINYHAKFFLAKYFIIKYFCSIRKEEEQIPSSISTIRSHSNIGMHSHKLKLIE